jgi:type II secretory pathway component PulF
MIEREEVRSLNLSLTSKSRWKSDILLVLSLISSGCTFEQTKKIIGCKETSLQELVSTYFGKSKNVFRDIRRFISDEQCLKIYSLLCEKKDDIAHKFLVKLIYPSFICLFSYFSLIFFKLTLLTKIRSISEESTSDWIYHLFDVTIYFYTLIFLVISLLLLFLTYSLRNNTTKNYFYVLLNSRIKDNLLTIYTTGIFAQLLLECMKTGVSTQNSLELLKNFSEHPFVVLLAKQCESKLSEGNTFIQSVTRIETDTAFKVFMQAGLYSNKSVEQLHNYCLFNSVWFDIKIKKLVNLYYGFVYCQFFITTLLLYQVIQIPMSAISSRL